MQLAEMASRRLSRASRDERNCRQIQFFARIHDVPNAHSPDIAGRLLLEKSTNFLNLGAAASGVEEQVAQLAAVWLDIDGALCRSRIALENQHLVLGTTFLLDGVHCACGTR